MLIPGECGHWGSFLFHLSDCSITTRSKISDIYSFSLILLSITSFSWDEVSPNDIGDKKRMPNTQAFLK